MSVKTVSTREDIDFDKHLIEIKLKLSKDKANFVKLQNIRTFYDSEGTDSYKVDSAITTDMLDLSKHIELGKEQLACTHDNIDFDKYVGHNSHKDFYKTYCTNCNLIIDEYDI